jgi:hypothetical protein
VTWRARLRRPSLHWIVLWGAVLGATVSLVLLVVRPGPDRTVVGRIVSVEAHRVCVRAPQNRAPTCASRLAPGARARISVGDCVELVSTPRGRVASIRPARGRCPRHVPQ